MAGAGGGGNHLVFKSSPLKTPPQSKPTTAQAAAPVHAVRDDVTLFIPGQLDGVIRSSFDAAPPAGAASPPTAPAAAPARKSRLLWLMLAALATVVLIVALLGFAT